MNNLEDMEIKIWWEVQDYRTKHRVHRTVDVYPSLVEDAYTVPINIISEDEMRKHGLETAHRRSQERRW